MTRLRQKAQTCEFGESSTVEEQIRDQVISGCLSYNLRMKLLQKGRKLTLTQLRENACVLEDAEKQVGAIEKKKKIIEFTERNLKKKAIKVGKKKNKMLSLWFGRTSVKG